MMEWISVNDRLPNAGQKVLITFRDPGGSIVDTARRCSDFGWDVTNWEVPDRLITHWMPLPEPPKE